MTSRKHKRSSSTEVDGGNEPKGRREGHSERGRQRLGSVSEASSWSEVSGSVNVQLARDFARHPQPLPPPTPNRKNASSPTNRANLSVSVFQAESVTTGGFSRAQTPILKGLALKGGPLTQPPASPVRPATPVVLSERDRAFESFKDLANGSSLISDWTTRFVANAVTYPPALTSIASHSLINGNSAISPSFPTPILASPVTPTTPLALEEPWRKIHASVSGGPTSKFPYALSLNKIENLPIPSFVDDVYLKDDARPLCLQMRLSLFDLETSTFFGRTWIDPEEFDLRAGSTATDGDSVSSSSLLDKRVAGLGILPSHESKDATLKKRRGIVLITDANGSGRNSDDEGRHDHEPRTSSKAAIKRAALAARAKSIKKKINKKLSQEKNELKEDISGSDSGSSKSERDYSEEDGDEIEDNPGIFSKKKLKHGTEKTLVHKRHQLSSDDGSDEDSSESDDNSDNDSGISSESDGAILKGHRVSINLHHEHLFMHTNLVSKNIIAVIEFVLIVEDTDVDEEEKDPDLFKPEYISAGWTYFHVFDGERGGIDIDRAWEYEEVYPYDETESCTPIFHGSPRILMFVAPLLMEYAVGYPSLAPIAGASFRFEFSTRPALRQLAYLWRENSWIGHGSDVPGLQFFSSSEMCAVEDTVAVVSKIHISVFPSLSKFELALLSEAALKHFQAFPESMTPDENGNLPLPEIIERRIHIGLHNTQTFLTAPNIITLKPVYSDYVGGDGFEFVFNGNIELEKYVAKNPGMAIVFVVEYKILMMTNQVTQKKTGLGAIIEKLTGEKKESTPLGIEKIVTVGWGAWTPTLFAGKNPQVIPLDTTVGPNPYSAMIFSPSLTGDVSEMDDDWLDYAYEMGRLATEDFPIVLSFDFYDEQNLDSPRRSSPVHEAIKEEPEEEEEKVPTPKRPGTPPPLPSKHKHHYSDDDSDKEDEVYLAHQQVQHIDASQFPKPSRYRGRKGGALTRAERARLQSAGFHVPVDENGTKPHQLTLTPGEISAGILINLDLEAKDAYMNNEITFTLMGVSFTPELCNRLTGHFPTSVYFTYQFYNFPYASTERMFIYNGPMPPGDHGHVFQHHRSSSAPHNPHSRQWSHSSNSSFHSSAPASQQYTGKEGTLDCYWPGILYPIDEGGAVAYAPAGLSRTYLMENDLDSCSTISSFSKSVPDIVQYLNTKSMHLDVWDGDSLLHLGSAVVELRPAMRQGRSGVVYDDDVDIVFTEYLNPVSLPRSSSHSSDMSSVLTATSSGAPERTSRSTVIGKLHIKLINIARHADNVNEAALAQKVAPLARRRDPYSKENVVVRDHRQRIQTRPELIVSSLKLVEIDPELAQMLSTAYEERVRSRKKYTKHEKEDEDYLEHVSERRRKLDRVKRVMARNHQVAAEASMPYYYDLSRQERQRDLDTIEIFRNRKKPSLIERKLAEQITVPHVIHASFGQAHYFEYLFTNPYSEDHSFEINWDDDELRLVTSASEWKYLRRIHSIRVGVEDKLISIRSNGTPEIYMLANETVSIPFVFQSFLGGTISNNVEGDTAILSPRSAAIESLPGGGIHPRCINISFLNAKRNPIAMIDLFIKPKNYCIDRVFRFFRSEGELLRRTVKFYSSTATIEDKHDRDRGAKKNHGAIITENSTIYDAAHPLKKYVKCNNPDVICTLTETGKGHTNLKELSFKYRVGSAPETSAIYFLIYDDPHHISLHEVWRVFIHSLHRLDLNCVLGQSNHASLVLRGSSFSRTVQCYSNLPDELLVTASAPFILTANSLNEIGMLMRPRSECIRDIIMNVVDTDDQSLVSSWLVVSHCSSPTVTKSFEISIPRGKAVNKRVSYTNPYTTKRSFRLKTNAEHLVQFREGNMLHLDGGASQYISLRLLPNSSGSWSDILVFLNDDHDKIEECLRIRVSYV